MDANEYILIDSNIIIYTGLGNQGQLRKWLKNYSPVVSAVSQIEVLGYWKLTKKDKYYFETFFSNLKVIPINEEVIEEAIALKQMKSKSLGDSIIAATAILENIPLLTANSKDFSSIKNLELIDLEKIQK